MDRRFRHVIVVGVAVLTAALASLGVYLTLKRMPVREVEVARTFVVVAARALPTGVRLSAADLKIVPWPASAMVPGGFGKVEDVVDRGLLSSVVENEPLVDAKLAPRNAGAGLSSAIPAGMRAMSVKVNDVIGVAGFLDPGTRVDLMVTIRRKDDSTSRTVASNLQVLTSGTRGDQQRPKEGKASTASAAVVTLLVSPEDAERIALAQAEGQIMLSLRNPLDTEQTASSGVRTAALFGQAAEPEPVVKAVSVRRAPPPPPVAAVAPPPPPKIYTVEAIRAAKRSEEVVH
jgi:pilus assembly protein CpaB